MKILFISSGKQPDYQCDCLYHGLKTKYGSDVEATSDMWFMYDTLTAAESVFLYGKGFTLYGLLDSNIKNVQEISSIKEKIRTRYYKYIIYGSLTRDLSFLDIVSEIYKSNEIVFVDGEDITSIDENFVRLGVYFKRELDKVIKGVYPISFGIPAEKIVSDIPPKSRDWALNYPGKLATYIYNEESAYYSDYQSSKYAVTFRKAGWDCLRHYEIIANGCLPYFTDIASCPETCMINFPKEIIKEIFLKVSNNEEFTDEKYNELVEVLLAHCREYLTTEALAGYLVDTLNGIKDGQLNKVQASSHSDDIYFINKVLKSKEFIHQNIKYSGTSSIQKIRFLDFDDRVKLYAEDQFVSAQKSLGNVINKPNVFITEEAVCVDVFVSDMVLPYESDVHSYMLKILNSISAKSHVVFIIPNYLNYSTVLNLKKGDFKFGRLEIGKKPQVNFYSKKTIIQFLKAYGFTVLSLNEYEFDNKSVIKRWLNKRQMFKPLMSKKIIIEAVQKYE